MLISALDARNFRKYNKLIINDIPESGVISISGSNESGKTSIGEAICFALFGRTFYLDENNLHKIICWGSDLTEVALTFKSGRGDAYMLYRSVDRNNQMKVKLAKYSDSHGIKENPYAMDDSDKVAEALNKILGFDYDAFSNSFYLAQRELTSPEPQSQAIKQMAGIAAYSKITDDLDQESQANKDSILELNPQVETNQAQLDELNLDESWLAELVDADTTLGDEQKGREQLVAKLSDTSQQYSENFTGFHKAKKLSGFVGLIGKLLLPISIVLWLLWLAKTYYREEFTAFVQSKLQQDHLAIAAPFLDNYLLPSAIGSLLVALLCGLICKSSKKKMYQLNQQVSGLSSLLGEGHGYVTTMVETLLPERVVQLLQQRVKDPSSLLEMPSREQFSNISSLKDETKDYKVEPSDIDVASKLLSDSIKKQDAAIGEINKTILDDVAKEKQRVDQADNIKSTLKNLSSRVDECERNIETRSISTGIMQRSGKHAIDKFNREISSVSASSLPEFTQGRYSKLLVADDFTVQIYSDEKQDYMDFDEVSSGTQRQVMLALRMAMSEQLAINSGNEEQFIFLDEPFAFFDQSRTKATFEALPNLSRVIKQVWVCAQEFPQGAKADKVIDCPAVESELIA